MLKRPNFAVWLSLLLLAACTTTGPTGSAGSGRIEQAASQQTPTTEVQRRAKLHVELGNMYLSGGRYEIALEESRVAMEIDGSYAPAHSLNALVYMALRQNNQAEQSFQRALSLARGDPEISNDYGWFLCRTNRTKESIAYFEAAFNNPLYQSPVKAVTNAGVCAAIGKDDRLGEEYLLRALRMDRGNTAALLWLAEIAYRGQRYADARRRLGELHGLSEPSPESAWLGLRVERRLGNRDGEARYTGILRSKYRDTDEYMKMSRGEFE